MSDAIKNAIEAMEFAQHAVGPFNRVATKKLRESIAELQAAQAQAVNQQLLESLVDLLKAARGGIKLDAPELSIGCIDAAINAIEAAQQRHRAEGE